MLVFLVAFPPVASATGMLDTFTQAFQSASGGWFTTAQGYGNDVFYSLLSIDLTWMALTWLIGRRTFDEMLPTLLRKVMVVGFFLALLLNAGTWLPDIVNGFETVGQNVGGVTSLTPSTLVDVGDDLAYGILTGNFQSLATAVPGVTIPTAPSASSGSTTTCNWWTLCLNKPVAAVSGDFTSAINKLIFFIVDMIFAMITWVSFLLIAFDLAITLIEGYVILGVGVFFLGFGASRWTTKFADGILNYAVSIGVKLLMLYMVVGVLLNKVTPMVVSTLLAGAANTGSFSVLQSLFAGGAGVVLMMMLTKSIPSKAQSLLGGGSMLGGAHGVQAAAGAAGGLAGGAAAATGAAAVAAGGAGTAFAGGASMAMGGAGVAARLLGGQIASAATSGGVANAAPPSNIPTPSAAGAAGAAAKTAGNATGAAAKSAGNAAGTGLKAAGAALAAVPVPGVAQAAGAALTAAGSATQAAGQVAGGVASQAGKAASGAADAAKQVASAAGGTASVAGPSASSASGLSAPGAKPLVPAPTTSSQGMKLAGTNADARTTTANANQPASSKAAQVSAPASTSNSGQQKTPLQTALSGLSSLHQNAGAQAPSGGVQATHISTGHGSD